MKVLFLPLAQAELDEAFEWYEQQAVGLGGEFLDEFNQSIRLTVSFPQMFEQTEGGLRRCLIPRFPYGIFYGIEDDKIVIVAVAHLRKKPGYWIGRT
ncbi:MAG: type II toxin-antitoxin system RelE/ParE family toxin [bacterium]|nr:type II toxin-antitoxin system RelE/ParE family toxin [bacterium]